MTDLQALTRASITRAFRVLETERFPLPDHLLEIEEEEPGVRGTPPPVSLLMWNMAPQIVPWFYRDRAGNLASLQAPYFGFYALASAFRGVVLGLPFLQAGDALPNDDFFAVPVVLYYTSAFHLVRSYLALNGRVLVEAVHGPPKVVYHREFTEATHRPLERQPALIVAVLTQENRWIFESRSRGHSERWKDLKQVLNRQPVVPSFLDRFFAYLLGEAESSTDLVPEGLRRLAGGRHAALYGGYGFDEVADDLLQNDEEYSGPGLGLKRGAYRGLALGFLRESIRSLRAVTETVDERSLEHFRSQLALSSITPPPERPAWSVAGEEELSREIGDLLGWLFREDEHGANIRTTDHQ